ncbi:MAG: cupin domain-containing protein [Acidobacteriia bacterium]|nr:cupin domain-containing protein [Terriglobia bacterium]
MHRTILVSIGLFLAASSLAQTKAPSKKAAAPAMATVVPSGSEKWGDIPAAAMVGTPSVDMGGKIQLAVVQGNPMAAGQPYTLRLSCTDGTKIAPHWHPTTENVTVVKGTFAIGMGSKWDSAAMKDLPAGSFASAPARMRHFATCKGDSVVQVHGLGPFVVNFVEPDKPKSGN